MPEACKGAEVIYARSWGSLGCYGHLEQEVELRQKYRGWIVNQELMSLTSQGYLMHCLPVRRNVEVTDEVLNGPRSLVIQQSANRLHLQKTLLSLILG